MEKILISSCLLGNKVRYDGRGFSEIPATLRRWQQEQRLIPLCPEMAGGLGCPRPPAEIQGGQGVAVLNGDTQVLTIAGEDVSAAFIRGAEIALKTCQQQGIQLAVLKARSPSCGNQRNYDGSFSGTQVSGEGVTAALLRQHNIRVFNEEQLAEASAYLDQLEQPSER